MTAPEDSSSDDNLIRAGEIFMHTVWIQGQMADLLIFDERPDLVAPFLATPESMPADFVDLRATKWQDDFTPIKNAFVTKFQRLLTADDESDLDYLNALRNAIAHSHVSLGRPYALYRPRSKSEQATIAALGITTQPTDAHEPPIVKLDLGSDAAYRVTFDRIKRIDEKCLARVADHLGVTHSRIR